MHEDTWAERTVDEFDILNVKKKRKRTFAVMLNDNPYDKDAGIWQTEPPAFLEGQTDADGNQIVRQYCLGDGGFRAIFTDEHCKEEVVVTSDEWKCETIVIGPRDINACFPHWQTDSTPITYGGPGDILTLFDPCIRSSDASFAPDFNHCDCRQDFNEDYVNWADEWFLPGFDDSSWVPATTYTEQEAVPKGGRRSTQLFTECESYQYCAYPSASWGDSQFIWSKEIELDNVVVCRYEYEPKCC